MLAVVHHSCNVIALEIAWHQVDQPPPRLGANIPKRSGERATFAEQRGESVDSAPWGNVAYEGLVAIAMTSHLDACT